MNDAKNVTRTVLVSEFVAFETTTWNVAPGELPNPWMAAVLSLISFLVGAVLPIIPWYITSGTAATVAALTIGVAAAAAVGAAVGRFAERPIVWSATRQVLIVLGACLVTWVIGRIVGINLA